MEKEEKIYELQKQIASLCDENRKLRSERDEAKKELRKWERMTANELGEMIAGM